MLFELESIFNWISSHIEINSVILTSNSNLFSDGLEQNELKIMSKEKLYKYITRFQKLIISMQHLPQTMICDINHGANHMGIELTCAADIRVGHIHSQAQFNFLQKAWVPCAGGIDNLSQLIGQSLAKQWIMASQSINATQLIQAGFLLYIYSSKTEQSDKINALLKNISQQSPVARIQTKRSFLEKSLPENERGQEYELIFAKGSLETDDWKKESHKQFTEAREMSKKIKQGLHHPGPDTPF